MVPTVAALYVERGGAYDALEGVEAWTVERDARRYDGPHPVVAHPPCERWGRYARGGPNPRARRREVGDDGGCFAAALDAVRRWGGVLEHPEASHAWRRFGLAAPPRNGGWVNADFFGGWTCCVEQGHYGHASQKATWLYAVGVELPRLAWGTSGRRVRLEEGFASSAARRMARAVGVTALPRATESERLATPKAFREVLLAMARTANVRSVGVNVQAVP